MKNNDVFKGISSEYVSRHLVNLKTPCYLIDEEKLTANAKILSSVMKHTGCKILLAQKAFSNYYDERNYNNTLSENIVHKVES